MNKIPQWVWYVAGAVGLYFLWRKFKTGASNLTAPVADAIAKGYVALTSDPAIVPSGSVILPDGSYVPVSSLKVHFDTNQNVAAFQYGGQQYVIPQGHDDNGNWTAVLASQANFPS